MKFDKPDFGKPWKLALEEHFAIPETVNDSQGYRSHWRELSANLLDVQKQMDKTGIELSILSLNAPAIQRILEKKKAVKVAQSLGFVWIPGVMAGLLVSGASPVYADIFQFVIVAMILAASGIAGLVATLFDASARVLERRAIDAASRYSLSAASVTSSRTPRRCKFAFGGSIHSIGAMGSGAESLRWAPAEAGHRARVRDGCVESSRPFGRCA
jgi:Uncharacterised protein family (UPF0014)